MAKDADIYALETALGAGQAADPTADLAAVRLAWIVPAGTAEEIAAEQALVDAADAALTTVGIAAERGVYLTDHAALEATITAGLDTGSVNFAAAETARDTLIAQVDGNSVYLRAAWGALRVLELRGRGGSGANLNSDLFAVRQAMADALAVTV